jgi:hypothetical protein
LTPSGVDIGTLWCTFFKRPGLFSRFAIRELRHAYRAPSLFASKMRDAGHNVLSLVCDEELRLSDLDGSNRTIQDDVDILFITSHGQFLSGGYQTLLHKTNWLPSNTGIGHSKLAVAVFDTCFLIDGSQNWRTLWSKASLGPTLRLLLGFDGLAAIDRPSALRGRAFAENLLNGKPFAESWIQAVHSTTTSQYNRAVAIAIGDTKMDALNVLNTASLSSIPGPRKSGQLFLEEKY